MRNCLLVFFMLLMMAVSMARSQEQRNGEIRQEITTPTEATDSKPNSADVPDAYAVSGKFERVLVCRFKDNTDLLAGLEKMVRQEKIRNAVILSGIVSVRSYKVHQVSNRAYPTKNTFVSAESPADIANMNGYVINGRLHPHITLANPEKAFGGHLESGTKAFTFAIITLGVLDNGVDLTNMDNKAYR